MKLNRKSGAKLAMTAAVLVVTGATLIGAANRRHGQGTLLRRQRLQGPGQLQEHQE